MATLRQHLVQWNNDYSAHEQAYYHATGAELVLDPYGSFAKGPQTITKSASVLIGAYNSKGPLEKSLLSIEQSSFNKEFPHLLEVIIVDDGSTDGTQDMMKNLDIDLTIKYVRQENGGLTKAHNTGLAFAEHDIIIFSDADIVHTQYALEELMKRHEVLSNVTLAGFRFEIDAADPRITTPNIRHNLHALLPEFRQDFRLNFPGWPDNMCRETQHWKHYGYNKKLTMANGASYDLPAMVVGAFFSIARADYVKMGGSDPRLVGWGCEDSLIGAKSIGLGNYIIPVYAAASAHISHTRRRPNEDEEFRANIHTATLILDEEFVLHNDTAAPKDHSHVQDFFVKTPSKPTDTPPQPCQPYQLGGHTAHDHAIRGQYYYTLGCFQQAGVCYAQALELAPEASWWHLGLGKTRRELQQYQAAIEAFSQCLHYDPHNAWAYYELGLTYGAMADYTHARQALEKARHLDASMFHCAWAIATPSYEHKSRGNRHAAQGDHHLAIRDFELALIVDDNNCWAHFDRGLSLRASGRLYDALQSFQKTDTLLHPEDSHRSWVHAELGKAYYDVGDYNNAKLQLDISLQLFPNNPQVTAHLEMLHEKVEQENSILCHMALLKKMQDIQGWFAEEEADLLIASVRKSASLESECSEDLSVVEVGSYCGKSTVVLGTTIKYLGKKNLKLYAIDPHEDYEFGGFLKTYPILKENIRASNIDEYVEIVKSKSTDVQWCRPITFLFIDGLHDYDSVKSDFLHFKDFVVPGGLVAFHDYFPFCPDVKRFVNEILHSNTFQFVAHRGSLIVIKKTAPSCLMQNTM